MDTFTRYFVLDADGETEEVYDGEDDKQLALDAAEEIGGTVVAQDYVSDGQRYPVTNDNNAE